MKRPKHSTSLLALNIYKQKIVFESTVIVCSSFWNLLSCARAHTHAHVKQDQGNTKTIQNRRCYRDHRASGNEQRQTPLSSMWSRQPLPVRIPHRGKLPATERPERAVFMAGHLAHHVPAQWWLGACREQEPGLLVHAEQEGVGNRWAQCLGWLPVVRRRETGGNIRLHIPGTGPRRLQPLLQRAEHHQRHPRPRYR